MTKEKFLELIHSPSDVSETALKQVKETTEAFPYFQPAHQLYAKLLKQAGNFQYDRYLKVAAAYSPDRKKLFDLMEMKVEKRKAEVVFEEKISVPPPPVILEEKHEPETNFLSEPEKMNPSPEEIIRKRLEEIEQEKRNKEEESAPSRQEEIIQELQPEAVYDIEEYFSVEEGKSNEDINPEGIPEKEKPEEVEETKIASAEADDKNIIEHKNESHSFLDWLAMSKPIVPDAIEKNIPEVKAQAEPKIEFITKEPEKKSSKSKSEILDKFIEDEPRITPSKASFYSPANMAKQSVEEHDDLVSPTLAHIYYLQGNPKKAIEAYQKLMLLYPEKSSLFAAQIEKIKSGNM